MSFILNTLTVEGSPGFTTAETQVKALIATAESNIARLTEQIRELSRLRAKELSVLATLRMLIVPIGKLPTEVLVEIFRLVVHTPVLRDVFDRSSIWWSRCLYEGDSRAALRKVLCLSQVSSYWRQLVCDTPRLWSEGVVEIRLNRELTDPYLSGFETMLARSTPYPISISLGHGGKKSSATISVSKQIANIVLPTVQRWRNFDIDLTSFPHFSDLPPGTFQALERLNINGLSEQTSPIMAFQSSPRLRTLALNTSSKLHLFHLPWGQLTHLHIEDESLAGCRRVLLQCTNLTYARISTSMEWDLSPEAANSPVAVLPFLTTLILTFNGSDSEADSGLAALFRALALPSLKTIDFRFDHDGEEFWPAEVFSEFQNRSPEIEEITIVFSSIYPEGLISLLRHAPALTTLYLECCWDCVNEDLFEALRYDDSDLAPVVPKLRDIHLSNITLRYFNSGPFENAIRSRWWKDGEGLLADGSPPRVSRLKKLWVCPVESKQNDDVKARVQDLIDQGLDWSYK